MQFVNLKTQQTAIRAELDRRIATVLDHGQYIMGTEVVELEAILATYVGVKHCVTVSSGTEALLIALMALGVGPGDEVVTTPFSFIATAEVIVLLGAKPVFVDVSPFTTNILAQEIEAKITPHTRAIIPVSLYGQAADTDAINAIAARHGDIPVIEDAAQSFGATYKGRYSGGLSTIGCTSFFPSKPLGCYGDGGALFTDDDTLAQAAREIRVHGQSKRYIHTRIGVGGRMDTLQCAILLAKWPRFAWELTERERIGSDYTRLIHAQVPGAKPMSAEEVGAPLIGLRTLHLLPNVRHVYAQYTVLVPDRAAVQAALREAGVPTAVHYPVPINQQPAYQHLSHSESTPNAAWLAEHVMSLPMGPDLTGAEQEQVVDALVKSLEVTNVQASI